MAQKFSERASQLISRLLRFSLIPVAKSAKRTQPLKENILTSARNCTGADNAVDSASAPPLLPGASTLPEGEKNEAGCRQGALRWLELYAPKGARTVLRGPAGSNACPATRLLFGFQRGAFSLFSPGGRSAFA